MYNKIFTLMVCMSFHLLEASNRSKTITFSDISLGLRNIEGVFKKVDISKIDNNLNKKILEHIRTTKLPTYQGINNWFTTFGWAIPKEVYNNDLMNIEIYLNAYSNFFASTKTMSIDSPDNIELYLQKIDYLDQQIVLMLQPLASFFEEHKSIPDLGVKNLLDYTISILRKVEP